VVKKDVRIKGEALDKLGVNKNVGIKGEAQEKWGLKRDRYKGRDIR